MDALSIKELLQFGLINIDKPAGPTSYSISEFVKRSLGLSKTSHMGTLDPKVTGVLPITLGRACRLANYFIRHDKTYVGILHTHDVREMAQLQQLIDDTFLGKIRQLPPKRSAVKRAERERTVYSFRFLEALEDGRDFLFECSVEGGTYIRKLCSDLGEMIGGAHMGDLRRTVAGIFSEEALYTLDEFEKAVATWQEGDETFLRRMVVSAEEAIKKVLPVVDVHKRALKGLHVGRNLFAGDVLGSPPEIAVETHFAVFCEGRFVGTYRKTCEAEVFGRAEFVYN